MWFLLSGYAVSMLSMYRAVSAQSLCFCSASSPAAVASDSAVPSLLKPAFLRCSVMPARRTLEICAVGPTGFLERAMSCTPPTHASELVHTVLHAPRTPCTPRAGPARRARAPHTLCTPQPRYAHAVHAPNAADTRPTHRRQARNLPDPLRPPRTRPGHAPAHR